MIVSRKFWIGAIVAAGLFTAAPAEAEEQETMRLSVLTYNIWGIPLITPARAERVQRIGQAIAELGPDLVALQEVWLDRDARALTAALAEAGLTHTRRFESTWPGHSGLLIASRHPIREVRFAPYSQGTLPHTLWHLDWIAGKGAARVRVETPVGVVDFAATHLQARYGTDRYLGVQLSQMLEASDLFGGMPSPTAPALIVAGDLNAEWSALPFRVLAARAALSPTDTKCGIDSVLYRSGTAVSIRSLGVRHVFDEAYPIDGTYVRLSDHAGVLANLEITRGQGLSAALTRAGQNWQTVLTEAIPAVRSELLLARERLVEDRMAGLLLGALAALILLAHRRWWTHRTRPLIAAAGMLLVVLAVWNLYLGLAYGPMQIEELRIVQKQLLAIR